MSIYSYAHLDDLVTVGNWTTVGSRARLYADVKISNSPDGDHAGTISGYAVVGADSTIGYSSYIGNSARLTDTDTIGHNVKVSSSVVLGTSTVVRYGTYIGYEARIGDGTIVGPGSSIASHVVIGTNGQLGKNAVYGVNGVDYSDNVYSGVNINSYAVLKDGVLVGGNIMNDPATINIGTRSRIGLNVVMGVDDALGSKVTVCDGAQVPDDMTLPSYFHYGC